MGTLGSISKLPVEGTSVVLLGGVRLLLVAAPRGGGELVLESSRLPGRIVVGARLREEPVDPRQELDAGGVERRLVRIEHGDPVIRVVRARSAKV